MSGFSSLNDYVDEFKILTNMKKLNIKSLALFAGIVSSALLTSCDSSDDMMQKEKTLTKTITVENVVMPKKFVQSGSFRGQDNPPIMPGESTNFKFHAAKNQRLMFITMYGASADWFFAPDHGGIQLYDEQGRAITGDVSNQIKLWDNGSKLTKTETEDANISEVQGVTASSLLKVSLAYDEATSEFTATITNTSNTDAQHTTGFSPGVFAVSNFNGAELIEKMPFFTPNQKSNPEVTAIAEGGNINPLLSMVQENTGIITGISPVLVVLYSGDHNPIFMPGQKDNGIGLKEVAQSGNSTKLMESLKKMSNVQDVFVLGTAPVGPGQKVMKTFTAKEGCKIAYVTMFGFSNDWFYANETGIPVTHSGNITSSAGLYDNGTAVDQYPGAGNKQPVFMGTSAPESKAIEMVGNMYPVPTVSKVLKITLQ